MNFISLSARFLSVAVAMASMADPTAMRWVGLVNFFLILITSLVSDINDNSASAPARCRLRKLTCKALVVGLTYLSGVYIALLGFNDAYTPLPSIDQDAKAVDLPRQRRRSLMRCRTESFSSVDSSDSIDSSDSEDSDQSSEYCGAVSVGEEDDDPLLQPMTLKWRPTTMYDDDTLQRMADLSAMQKYLRTLLAKKRRRARQAA